MSNTVECECGEEYGPCEEHGTVLAQREGASLRTADELLSVYLHDARSIDPEVLSPYGLDVLARADAALDGPASWLDDSELADELAGVAWQVESALDADTYWEDGYIIVRVTGGPLADDAAPVTA